MPQKRRQCAVPAVFDSSAVQQAMHGRLRPASPLAPKHMQPCQCYSVQPSPMSESSTSCGKHMPLLATPCHRLCLRGRSQSRLSRPHKHISSTSLPCNSLTWRHRHHEQCYAAPFFVSASLPSYGRMGSWLRLTSLGPVGGPSYVGLMSCTADRSLSKSAASLTLSPVTYCAAFAPLHVRWPT